jgi:hypothetical protein
VASWPTAARSSGSISHSRSERSFRPFHSVGLQRVNKVTTQTPEFGAPIFCQDGFHSFFAMRAAGRIHGRPLISPINRAMEQKFPYRVWYTKSGEIAMQAAIERVMQTYTMIRNLNPDEERATRQKVAAHLAGKPEADEHAVEGLRYLRSVRD